MPERRSRCIKKNGNGVPVRSRPTRTLCNICVYFEFVSLFYSYIVSVVLEPTVLLIALFIRFGYKINKHLQRSINPLVSVTCSHQMPSFSARMHHIQFPRTPFPHSRPLVPRSWCSSESFFSKRSVFKVDS